MRRIDNFKVVVMFVMLFALSAWAANNEPWKTKAPQDWDQTDITKILSDSPWVKRVAIPAPWQKPQKGSQPAPNPMGDSGSSQQAPPQPQDVFLVRWNSSQITRQAVYRQALAKGMIKQEDMDKGLAEPVDDYQVLVIGSDMTPFDGVTDATISQDAYLQTKKGKDKIPPKSVQIQKGDDGKVTSILFTFFKKTGSGEDNIPQDAKNVDFDLTMGQVKLKAVFEPSKMVNQQGNRDL